MDEDFNAQLASHENIIRYLTALIVKMDGVIYELKEGQALIIQLLQRHDGGEAENGTT